MSLFRHSNRGGDDRGARMEQARAQQLLEEVYRKPSQGTEAR
ncbi:MAG: hypothetical protein ACRDPY_03750 [Streptosporangiaceae bacterium]